MLTEVSIIENLILSIAPESLSESSLEDASLSISDVNLLIRHSLRLAGQSNKWNARVSADKHRIDSILDWKPLPEWIPLYITIKGGFLHEENQLRLDQLAIGKLQIPTRWTAQFISIIEPKARKLFSSLAPIEQILKTVKLQSIDASNVQIQLLWEPELISTLSDQAQRLLISPEDQERIAEHTGQKVETIEADSDRDRWFTAEEARDYGIIDQVIVRRGEMH